MRVSRYAALAALTIALTDCGGCRKEKRPNGPTGDLPALTSKTETAALAVPGFLDAVVSIPAGATRPMPVVVAVLGIGDTPEEQCETWRDVVGVRAFVLCPRGAKHYVLPEEEDAAAPASPASASASPAPASPAPPAPKAEAKQVGYYPVDLATLDKEIGAGMAALKQRYGQYVADNWIYAGFSRGAFLGASFVTLHPDKFGRAVFIEGGQSAWTSQNAAAFAARGGKRVLFACGQPSCLDESNPVAALLKSVKTETRVVIGQGEGHGYKKQVKEELKKNFEWVVEGDPTWAP